LSTVTVSPLRQRMIEDMTGRHWTPNRILIPHSPAAPSSEIADEVIE
jgi:hypothetical protein